MRTEAYEMWEAVQDSAKENKAQEGSERDLSSNPNSSVASCVPLGMFLQISGHPFPLLHMYNDSHLGCCFKA